jgi:hypothetical protein
VAAEPLPRVRVGGMGVHVIKDLTVDVTKGLFRGEGVAEAVGLIMNSVISTTVRATAVLMGFAKAELTTSLGPMGSISEAVVVPGFASAAADTRHIKLNPSRPAARTVNGAEYLRISSFIAFISDKATDRFCMTAPKGWNARLPLSFPKYSTVRRL